MPLRWMARSRVLLSRMLEASRMSAAARGGYWAAVRHQLAAARRFGIGPVARRVESVGRHGVVGEPGGPGGNDRGTADETQRYRDWIARTDRDDQTLFRRFGELGDGPLISVLMPVSGLPIEALEATIESVRNQRYRDWELCIVDDAGQDPAVTEGLERAAREDVRIRVLRRDEHGDVCTASNEALAMARGAFAALLDQGDTLHPFALYRVAQSVLEDPAVDLIYSDEDRIDDKGRRHAPHMKSAFNHELLLSQDYLSHLTVARTAMVREVGGFRPGFEGASGRDLVLRVLERIGPDRVRHLPFVLYHRRDIAHPVAAGGEVAEGGVEGSEVADGGAGPDAVAAACRTVEEYLARVGTPARVVAHPEYPGGLRPIFDLGRADAEVEIIVPTRDRLDLLGRCVESLRARTTYRHWRLCIVDNGSVEPATMAAFDDWRRDARIRILRVDEAFNFSRLNNLAVQSSSAEYVVLLNNDIEIGTPNWIEEMLSHASRPGVGCVGVRLWYPDGRLQHAGVVLGLAGIAGHPHNGLARGQPGYFGRAVLLQSYSAVTAACLMVRRDHYLAVGGLDERLAIAFNDIDFCLKIRALGLRNVWTPFAEHIHHESASRGAEDDPDKRSRFESEARRVRDTWGPLLDADPAYSPNLTLRRDDFTLQP